MIQNEISLDGELGIAFSEDIQKRAESVHWQYVRVEDGNDVDAITKAITLAKENTDQPTLIEIRTIIGYGSPKVAGTNKAHGNPLGVEEATATKQVYGWDYEEDFFVPEEVTAHFNELKQKGIEKENEWNEQFNVYRESNPALADELEKAITGEVLIEAKDILSFDTEKRFLLVLQVGKLLIIM